MAKLIDVNKTVENILKVENVQFKLLKRDEKQNTALLVTPTNDDFARGIISIDSEKISVGVQSPDKDGKITITLQPTTVEILEIISFVEIPEPVQEAE